MITRKNRISGLISSTNATLKPNICMMPEIGKCSGYSGTCARVDPAQCGAQEHAIGEKSPQNSDHHGIRPELVRLADQRKRRCQKHRQRKQLGQVKLLQRNSIHGLAARAWNHPYGRPYLRRR